MTDETLLRRTPQQERSQQRVDEILDAAAALLEEVGYEGITTSAIARRAEISVGSLYQFFANKDAVLYGLAKRYLADMGRMKAAMFSPDSVYVPLPILVGRTVDLMVDYMDTHKGFHQVFSSAWVSPELKAVAEAMNVQILENIENILMAKAPDLDKARRHACALVMMHLTKSVLQMMEAAPSEARSTIIEEVKRAGVAYMESVVAGQGK